MSDYEHHKGTLKLEPRLENETLEDQCKRLLNNEPLPSYYDSYEEMFHGEMYRKAIIYNESIYVVDDEELDPYNDVYVAYHKDDGNIGFEIKYYNGGCSFSEAIEKALKKLI